MVEFTCRNCGARATVADPAEARCPGCGKRFVKRPKPMGNTVAELLLILLAVGAAMWFLMFLVGK